MTRVVFLSPRHVFSKRVTYYMLKRAWWPCWCRSQPEWRRYVALCPPSTLSDRSLLARKRAQQHWLGPWARPLPHAHPCPPYSEKYISYKKPEGFGWLNGRASRVFPTHARDVYSPIGKNWHSKSWIGINIGVIWMIFCQYGSIMCIDTAFIMRICIPNVTIYVFVHEEFHEIYL